MTPGLNEQIIFALIDKLLLGLVAGVILMLGQYYVSRSIERIRSSLAYKQTLAESRITHLRDLWEAIHSYGVSIAGALRGEQSLKGESLKHLIAIVENFDRQVSKCGIFLGRERIESIKSKIGGAFLHKLVASLQQPSDLVGLLSRFQEDWINVLDELEKELLKGTS